MTPQRPTTKQVLVLTLAIAAALGLGFTLGRARSTQQARPVPAHLLPGRVQRHVLSVPMPIRADGVVGILPKGTTLEYVETLPEGIDRYKVYVNVERLRLPLATDERVNLVSPISFVGEDIADDVWVAELLKALGIGGERLARIARTYDAGGVF